MRVDELRVGAVLELNEQPYIVLKSDFMKTAQRRPVMRTKLRNLKDGSVLEKTFKQGDKVDAADVNRSQAQYLYKDGEQFYFMDQSTFEQFSIPSDVVAEAENYLKESEINTILNFSGTPIAIELPIKVDFKVVEAPPGIKGDTAQGGVKEVTLENGLKVNAPLFIKVGDTIRVNTGTGKYSERAEQA
ncbi:MAG: elongation factor P [bacterium]|nr:elongation factor P [bacterium]